MLYGCCVNLLPKTLDRIGLEYAGRLKRLGYDYIELPLNELAQLSEQEFRDARTVLEELDLPCRACNDFMPARFQITGPDVTSRAELTDYLRRALERAARLVCCNLAAVLEQADLGRSIHRPACVVAEGSTFYKGYLFRRKLERLRGHYPAELETVRLLGDYPSEIIL